MSFARLAEILARERLEGELFVVGTRKNAGKTTLLGAILSILEPSGVAVTSIGIDGEPRDLLDGSLKPAIYLPKGALVVTASGALVRSSARLRVLRFLQVRSVLGELALWRVERSGSVLVVGPETNDQLRAALGLAREAGARLSLIDGAYGRRTQIFAGSGEVRFFLCAAPEPGWDAQTFARRTAHTLSLLTLPVVQLEPAERQLVRSCPHDSAVVVFGEDCAVARLSTLGKFKPIRRLILPGALARNELEAVLAVRPAELVVRSGAFVFLGEQEFAQLKAATERVLQMTPTRALGVALRSTGQRGLGLNPAEALALVADAVYPVPVFDLFFEGSEA